MTWEHYKHIQLLSKSKNHFADGATKKKQKKKRRATQTVNPTVSARLLQVVFLTLSSISEQMLIRWHFDQHDLEEAAHIVVLPELLLLLGPPGSQ